MSLLPKLSTFASLAGHLSNFKIKAAYNTKNTGPGTAKSYHERPGSGLLTREEITRRRRGNPKGSYSFC